MRLYHAIAASILQLTAMFASLSGLCAWHVQLPQLR